MAKPHIVVHYHELWLKGGNRRFFLGKLITAMKRALEGVGVERLHCPGDRIVIELREGAAAAPAVERLSRVFGIAYFAVARVITREQADADVSSICRIAWEELAPLHFSSFAVRSKRSDKSFALTKRGNRIAGWPLFTRSAARGRPRRPRKFEPAGSHLPDRSHAGFGARICTQDSRRGRIAAQYRRTHDVLALRRIRFGGGGLQNDAARSARLLRAFLGRRRASGRFVGARGARTAFGKLVPWQFTAKLYLVPFEPLQREIVAHAPETFRVLLYRRLMLRIAEHFARQNHSLGIITGDSLGQVASQTLHNMAAVGVGGADASLPAVSR